MQDNLPKYSGWRPVSMRLRSRGAGDGWGGPLGRKAKRSRLHKSPAMRHIYKSAHGHKSKLYGMLCIKADAINNRSRG